MGKTELLLDTPLDTLRRDCAQTIRRSSRALALSRVINDVLDFSKVEAGTLELVTVDMILRSVVAKLGVRETPGPLSCSWKGNNEAALTACR